MNERNTAWLLPIACLALALAAPQLVEAQFGGLGRRITEGAKKAAGVESTEPKPDGTPKPVVLRTDDPYVIPITDTVLKAFEKGLQTELDLVNQLRQELAARETAVQQHEACKQQVARSPEYVEVIMGLSKLPENPSTEEMQRAMAKMTQDGDALVLKKCGPVPPAINGADRLQEIRRKAVAAAGPVR